MLREGSDEEVSGGAVAGESEDSKEFAVRVGIHQGSILSLFIFATERRMLRMICGVTLKDVVESTVIASSLGVDDLEEHLG